MRFEARERSDGGNELKEADRLRPEIESPRGRLAGLSRASLRITEDPDLEARTPGGRRPAERRGVRAKGNVAYLVKK